MLVPQCFLIKHKSFDTIRLKRADWLLFEYKNTFLHGTFNSTRDLKCKLQQIFVHGVYKKTTKCSKAGCVLGGKNYDCYLIMKDLKT